MSQYWEGLYKQRNDYRRCSCHPLCENCKSYLGNFEAMPYSVYEDYKAYCHKREEEEKCITSEQAN